MRNLLFLGLTALSIYAHADAFLSVPHYQQQTGLWCWAAAAQQIIAFKQGGAPPQCQLVEVASGFPPGACCNMGHPACVHGGNFSQVANLIAHYGGAFSNYVLPANPYIIEATLKSGRPILAQVVSGFGSTHVVVIRGIQMNPVPTLIINDPLMPAPYTVPFSNLATIWLDGIVVN
jgi:hypothetical protein